MSVTEEIKSRLDLVDIVSEQVSLRRSGRNYTGFCPFHSNTRTPAFVVFPDSQTWRCFGECATGGDLFDYVMKKEGYDFKEALKVLAQRAGVVLEEPDPQAKKRRKEENKLVDLLNMAAEYFHQLLLYAPQGQIARDYVANRRLSDETTALYRLGFALDSWDACRTHFNDQGYSDDELLAAGLLTENPDKGTRYDRFRSRLMIPIRDVDGRVVGFGARTLEKDGIPKYLNSPQTEVFDKGHLLFGFDLARRHIREAREAVIVEGYMDVMQGWQAGFRNMVAQMGTALTGDQLRLLKRSTKRFVLALDADAAGQNATMRSLQVARDTLDRDYETRFDARGLVQQEGRLQADIRIVTLPEGNDPDQIIRADPAKWPELIAQAQPVVAYVIDIATRGLDQNDAKAKSAVARQVLPLIKDIVDPVEREHYRQQLARALRVDERTLRLVSLPQEYTPSRQPKEPDFHDQGNGATQASTPSLKSATAHKKRADNLLRQCLQYSHLILQVNQKLIRHEQRAVSDNDFYTPEDRQILSLIYERSDQTPVVTIDELCDSLDDVFATRIQHLMQLKASPESELTRLPEQLAKSVLDWRVDSIHSQLSELQQLMIDLPVAPENQDQRNQLILRINELQIARQKANRAKDAMTGSGQRRAEQAGSHRSR
jgi:DNA primase